MPTVEERKIALQEKWFDLRKEMLLDKQKENGKETQVLSSPPPASPPPRKFFEPVTATILVAIIGFVASAITTSINNANTVKLEQRKFETELIKKSLDQKNQGDVIKSLQLLTTLSLLHDEEVKKSLENFLLDTVAAKKALPGFSPVPISQAGRDAFLAGVNETLFKGSMSVKQKEAILQLFDFIKTDTSIKDVRYVAYMLATIYHETAKTMQPLEEYNKGQGHDYGQKLKMGGGPGKRIPYDTPDKIYYGRGYVPVTWYENYEDINKRLNLQNTKDDILENPDLLLKPVFAYRALSVVMTKGLFTGRKLSNYINADGTDYVNARKIINGLDRAEPIAGYARTFEKLLRTSLVGEQP